MASVNIRIGKFNIGWKTLLLGIFLLIAAFVLLQALGVTHFFNKSDDDTRPTAAESNYKEEPYSGKAIEESSPTRTPDSPKNSSQQNQTTDLLTPTGNFVSNHRPNISGQPAPNQLQSTCTTTPGAKCKIVFTKGTSVIALPDETADQGGNVYWSWSLQQYGLTRGSWHIQAVATLNNQTKTANDALNLEVGP